MTEDNVAYRLGSVAEYKEAYCQGGGQMMTPRIPMVVWPKMMMPIAMVVRPKTTPHIAVAAWQTTMPVITMVAQQMTTSHIVVVVRQNMSWLLRCLPLHHPLVLLLCCPLAAPACCCMASI
jgi:hypothetical protein